MGLSAGTIAQHLSWINDINQLHRTELHYPVVADPDLKIARIYDMIHAGQSETETVRSVIIIDPCKARPADDGLPNERRTKL